MERYFEKFIGDKSTIDFPNGYGVIKPEVRGQFEKRKDYLDIGVEIIHTVNTGDGTDKGFYANDTNINKEDYYNFRKYLEGGVHAPIPELLSDAILDKKNQLCKNQNIEFDYSECEGYIQE